jgi:putative Ca2+/H+ antiporter (TMEM165/GDT1 family)
LQAGELRSGGDHVSGLLITAIVFGTVFAAELPDNSGLASLVLGTRYRPGWVFAVSIQPIHAW